MTPPTRLCVGYAVLLIAWAVANPPFASPDERSHYLRAIGIAGGQLIGEPFAPSKPPATMDPRSAAWMSQAMRAVKVPLGLYSADLQCNAVRPTVSAACLDAIEVATTPQIALTPTGNYQPLPYLLPGLAARIATHPLQADRFGRAAAALGCWLLLVVATCLVWGGHTLSLLGLVVAVTPMAVFIAASLTPSGLEISAGITFAAALLRLSRDGQPARWVWLATGVAGAVLALSRSMGPIDVALMLALFLLLVGPRGVIDRVLTARRDAALASTTLAFGFAISWLWEREYGSRLPIDLATVWRARHAAIDRLPGVLREEVGVFGSLDTTMPMEATWAWAGIAAALILMAMMCASRRQRLVLAGAIAGAVALPIAMSALMTSGTGFDVQGRHVLAVVAMVPLLAGEIVFDRRERLPASLTRAAVTVASFIAGAVHFTAWFWNARRHAVGVDGRLWFFSVAEWSPPGGWWVWTVAVVAGCACVALCAGTRLAAGSRELRVESPR